MNLKRINASIIIGLILLFFVAPSYASYTSKKEAINLNSILKTEVDTIASPLSKYYVVKLNMDTIPPQFDTITVLYNNYIAVLDYLNDEAVPVRYIAPNPHYYRITVPMAYYNSPIKRYGMQELKPYKEFNEHKWKEELLPFDQNYFTKVDRTNKLVDHVLMAMYMENAGAAYTTEDKIMGHELYIDQILNDKNKTPKKKVSSFFTPEDDLFTDLSMVDSKIKRPNWWHTGGEGSLQVTQNYFSANWYKGGESNNSVLGNVKLFANYNDKKKIQIENLFEAKLGFNTVPSDTLRSYRVNSDQIRFSSKLGVRATKKWFYTLSSEVNTQFSRNFKKNSEELMSSFMTPFNFIFSLGMDFKEKREKINLSVVLSPASYNFRYLRNTKVNPNNFGMKEGRTILHDIGSKLDSTIEWKIISSIRLQSRLSCFTNYSKVVAEWESTFDFILNRYLSTKLFFHARFDDSAKKIEGSSYLQFKELLSFGVNYRW